MSDQNAANGRIAIFSPFYYPEMISTGKVNTLLAQELVRLGWYVDVFCSHPLYPDWQPTKSDANMPSIKIRRGGAWVHYAANPLLRRVALELWFALHAAVGALSLPKDTRIALFVYPPSLFGPLVQFLLPKKVRRVALVHDLQGEYSQLGYHSGFRLLTWIINIVEKRSLRGSDCCIFFSKDMARAAARIFGIDKHHMSVQYPFVTVDPESAVTHELEPILLKDAQHIVYSGALGEKQNPEELAQFMDHASERIPDAQFHIFSSGPIFESLRKKYAGKSRLQFHGLLPESQLMELYARSSVQLIPQAPGTEHGSLPSKLPNLLAAGVQILAICSESSEVASLLGEANTGTVVSDWTSEHFTEGVRSALGLAADVDPKTRRDQAKDVLALCRVSSLTDLIVG